MRSFPFPDRVASREELKRDILYHRIPDEDKDRICDAAWDKGAEAARMIIDRFGKNMSIHGIIAKSDLSLEHVDKDNVVAGVRYFSEYFSGPKKISIYDRSIEKWAKANHMPKNEAEELILAHEFYHHLECTQIGLASKDYKVANLKIGNWIISKSGIRALSEIGAHGFSRTFFDLQGRISPTQENATVLQNRAMNIVDFEGKRTANKVSTRFFGKILMENRGGKK